METLRLRVCTWNVGNAPPPSDLVEWLGLNDNPYDIIAVAAQETSFKDSDSITSSPIVANSSENALAEASLGDNSSSPGRKLRKIGRALKQPLAKRPAKPSKFPDDLPEKRPIPNQNKAFPGDGLPKKSNSTKGGLTRILTDPELDCDWGLTNNIKTELELITSKSMSAECITGRILPTRPGEGISGTIETSKASNIPRIGNKLGALNLRSLQSDEHIAVVSGSIFLEDDDDYSSQDESFSENWAVSRSGGFTGFDPDDEGMSSDGDIDIPPASFLGEEPRNQFLERRNPGYAQSLNDSKLPGKNLQPVEDAKSLFYAVPEENTPLGLRQAVPVSLAVVSPTAGSKKFSKCVQRAVGDNYLLVAKHHLMEIKLLIFVHRKHKARIGKTEMTSEATGIGNVVGNKGAVAVKLTIDDTSFCFVSSHLAAHEGAKFLSHRNSSVEEIMRNLERSNHPKSVALPAIHQYSHIIWMGDLNYRLDPDRTLPSEMTFDEKWDYVHEALKREDFATLQRFDELRGEMLHHRVFSNFSEGEITFLPTFKVVRGLPGNEYQRLRIPSYCDRILWHSLPMHAELLRLVEYSSLPSYCTSDHKPVFAQFDVDFPKRVQRYRKIVPKSSYKCTVDFKKLILSGLYEKLKGDVIDIPQHVVENGSVRNDDRMLEKLYGGEGDSPARDPVNQLAHSPRNAARNGRNSGALSPFANDGPFGAPSPNTSGMPEGGIVSSSSQTSHTRRGVRVEFHGNGFFLRNKHYPTDVSLKNGCVRACSYNELPKIALIPVADLGELMYGYVTLVFTRWGSKIGSSCILPLAEFFGDNRNHHMNTTLELTKFGKPIAAVDIEAELCISMETWIDSKNTKVKTRKS